MMVGSRGFGSGAFARHLVGRAHKKSLRRRAIIVGLTLTSMVDMFSLLVIFLLQAFSASPELLVLTKGVTLPTASTGREIKDAPVISIATDGVYLDQKLVGNVDAVLRNPDVLMERLASLRELWEKSHPNGKFPGEINLQAHYEIPSTVVSQIMGMLPSQAYGSIQLAVVSGGKQ